MKLRKVKLSDWEHLLRWRNDLLTRKNSQNFEIVEPEGHKKWIRSAIKNPQYAIFIALENEEPVGTIRSERNIDSGELKVSWTIAPEFRNRGLGKQMALLFDKKLKEKYHVEIKLEDKFSVGIANYIGLIFEKEEGGKLFYHK